MAFYPNDMLESSYLVGAVNDTLSRQAIRQQYMGLELLPWEEVPERNVTWDIILSENPLAGIYGPRGEAVPFDEMMFDSDRATLADIKASMFLEKWTSQTLREPGMLAVYDSGRTVNAIQALQDRVSRDINRKLSLCNEAVDSQVEYLIMNGLQNSIVWPPVDNDGNAISTPPPHWNANLTVSLTAGLPADQVQNVTTLTGYNGRTGAGLAWTNASATPFNDLEIFQELLLKNKGVNLRGGKVIMSSIVLGWMARNTSILNWMAGVNKEQPGARGFAPEAMMREAVQAQFGWTIETYDSQWTYRSNNPGTKATVNRVDFLKEGKVIILPPGPVGTMMTAPQEAEPNGQWVYRKIGWSWTDPKPPYDVELGVNVVSWPRWIHRDWVVLDVYN